MKQSLWLTRKRLSLYITLFLAGVFGIYLIDGNIQERKKAQYHKHAMVDLENVRGKFQFLFMKGCFLPRTIARLLVSPSISQGEKKQIDEIAQDMKPWQPYDIFRV